MKIHCTPTGKTYAFYEDLLKEKHLLVAGATGSGKSVIINGMLYHALYDTPIEKQFILIDPKRVELIKYKNLPHTLFYATEPEHFLTALNLAMDTTEKRYRKMQKQGVTLFNGSDLYVIIDEYADMVLAENGRKIEKIIQRLCQIGRAARVHVILATQTPIGKVLKTEIKCNIDSRIALRTRSKQDSRNIIECAGCEKLPLYGYCYLMTAAGLDLWKVPYIPESETKNRCQFWEKQNRPLFKIF